MLAAGVVFGCLFLLIFLGIEIPMTLGLSTFLAVHFIKTPMDVGSIAQGAATILPDSITLVAIPLFALTGSLISNSFIASRLILVANALVGRMRGGLAVVNVLDSFLFGGISGSAAADTASIGAVMIPMMIKNGYPRDFSVVVTITTSCLGPIVPPSIIMIVFGWLTNTSIGALFVAGYLPGVVVAAAQISLCLYYSYRYKYPISDPIALRTAAKVVLLNMPIVLLPVAIIAGIVTGIFSPTEAGAFGAVYSLTVLVMYGALPSLDLRKVLTEVAALTGICGFLLAFAGVFSRFLTYSKAPILVTEAIMPYVSSPVLFLGIVVVIWLFLGCVMNPVAAMTMTLPILFPISQQFEIHPLHLAMVTTVALAIGHVTPPVGISLFIGSSIAKMGIDEVIPMLLPFILVMLLVVVVLILVPGFSLWLPGLFGYA